jgi:hypothetical protein
MVWWVWSQVPPCASLVPSELLLTCMLLAQLCLSAGQRGLSSSGAAFSVVVHQPLNGTLFARLLANDEWQGSHHAATSSMW